MSTAIKRALLISGVVLVGASTFVLLRNNASKRKSSKAPTGSASDLNVVDDSVADNYESPQSVQPARSNLKGYRMFISSSNQGTDFTIRKIPFDARSAYSRSEQASTPYFSEMASRYAPQEFMSSQDYYALVNQGFIPQGFNPAHIVSTTSNNGTYKYMIGFSDPYTTRAAKDSFNVISPLWAVVYDVDSNVCTDGPLQIPNVSQTTFEDVLQRTLFAEWMLTRSGFGCSAGSTFETCNAERGAIANAVIQRALDKYRIFQSENPLAAVFKGPGQKWNNSDAFMSAYNGYAGKTGFKDAPKTALPSLAVNNFNSFYSNFWFMPKLALSASSFIHPKSLSISTPSWAKSGDPRAESVNYASLHPIKIGEAVFIDSRKTFK